MIRRSAAFAFAASLIFAAGPVAAQDGPEGIGFAQAEEGTWYCRGADAATVLQCAADLCKAEAGGQDCYQTAWCFPARWSGVVTVWLGDFHANTPICGAPSLEALTEAMRAFCDNAEGATACDTGVATDPDGMEVDIAEHWEP